MCDIRCFTSDNNISGFLTQFIDLMKIVLKISITDDIEHPHPHILQIMGIKREMIIGKKLPVDRVDLFTFDQGIVT